MKVSDYIVEFLIKKGVSDVFGYPGGMVTHLMDSFEKRKTEIAAHVNYHEQGAAFAACGYAQASGKTGVAYATSGPGATNLITGICHAWFDSVPVLFITGQVNTFESKGEYGVRQRGFQETDIVGMVQGVTKYCALIDNVEKIPEELEKAWKIAQEDRKGPVLLDIPMNIFRSELEPVACMQENAEAVKTQAEADFPEILAAMKLAKRPCIVAGAGVRAQECRRSFAEAVAKLNIPVVTSMIAVDLLPDAGKNGYGFIGAYGNRAANFIVAKSDLVLTLGTRLDVRQVGGKRENFAPEARIIRVDIDPGELTYQVRGDETDIQADAGEVLSYLVAHWEQTADCFAEWLAVCDNIKDSLEGMDDRKANRMVTVLSEQISAECVVTTDVGQNQVWVAQSFKTKKGQQILFSGGHGAMGYSLPAAIGAYYGTGKTVVSFQGDGGFQMNIQELQFIAREKLPVKVIVFNNYALGMIRHFQEMYFESSFSQTVTGNGYDVPDLKKIAEAYGLDYYRYETQQEINGEFMHDDCPALVEVVLEEPTCVFPKLEFGKPNQDQEPLIERKEFDRLMNL